MKRGCRYEDEVLSAVVEGTMTESLALHIADCETCSLAVETDGVMKDLSGAPLEWGPLPDPGLIWLKAQLMRNRDAAERASRPVTLAQQVAWGCVALAWAALLAWQWPTLNHWVVQFRLADLITGSAHLIPISTRFIWTFAALSLITATLSIQNLLLEE